MADQGSMRSVARWGYASAVQGDSQGWVRSAQYEPIDASYLVRPEQLNFSNYNAIVRPPR